MHTNSEMDAWKHIWHAIQENTLISYRWPRNTTRGGNEECMHRKDRDILTPDR